MNTIVVETAKQLRSMAKHAGLKRYFRMKKEQLLELIETKTEHVFKRIPKPGTKKEIMIEAKQHGLKGISRLPKNQLLTKVDTDEKYILFTKRIQVGEYTSKKDGEKKPLYQHLRSVDSVKFMSTSLEKLIEAILREGFKNMEKVFGDLPLDPELYKVNPST
ncbi:unnamed protein product [Mytilus coruscus]|uniref:Rho termination factor N-terminal domain-containing protein n=1 Tax=Mytilus coruscus TaxID=42192 RepID=A0A6J8E4N8_MYTCO|nr:unnamed protein product [Mytilus coruscus]